MVIFETSKLHWRHDMRGFGVYRGLSASHHLGYRLSINQDTPAPVTSKIMIRESMAV
jgi:hypothetical protein